MNLQTTKVEFKESGTVLDKIRGMSKGEFIENHGSGTLRKASKLGIKHNELYWSERIAYDFGWEFEKTQASRVTIGEALVEGDNKSSTEFGWFAERYLGSRVFPEDVLKPCFIQVEIDGVKREGNGLFVEQTSLDIPEGIAIFAIIAEYDTEKKEWCHARNPF